MRRLRMRTFVFGKHQLAHWQLMVCVFVCSFIAQFAVLSNQKSKGDAKKGANKTEKWEEELRQSLKAKSGPVKKLTKDELALVDGQLQQETQIRQRMQIISDKISESLNFVERLALGNPDAARQRITSLMNFVLAYLKQPIESFVGQQGITTYMVGSRSF